MITKFASSPCVKPLYTLIVLAYFTAIFSSCSKSNDLSSQKNSVNSTIKKIAKISNNNTTTGERTSVYTGEDIFKAIAFNLGAAANLIPSLSGDVYKDTVKTSGLQASQNQFAEELIIKIKVLNPLYFDTLKLNILSDDYFVIDSALGKMGDIAIQGALLTTHGQDIQVGLNIASQININSYDLTTDQGIEAYRSDIRNTIEQNRSMFPAGIDCIIAAVVFIAAALILVLTHAAVIAQGLIFILAHSIVAAKVRVKISAMMAARSKYSFENLTAEIANAF